MSGSTCGLYTSENAGMSSENYVRIIMAENLRFPGQGSSFQGKSGAKARPRGVVDAQTVEIPLPPKDLSTGTHRDSRTPALVDRGERDEILVGSRRCSVARKAVCTFKAPVPQTDTGR